MLQQFYKQYPDYKVIYLTKVGSKLYGTDTPESDTDYKGIFIPTKQDVLLKKDPAHFTTTTGNNKARNTKEDVDIQLWSIYKFLDLVAKGETGAIDLLFSIKREDTQIFKDYRMDLIENNINNLLHKKLHSFIGYCIGQSKKYNIKSARYNELVSFIKDAQAHNVSLKTCVTTGTIIKEYKYIKTIMAPGPKANKGQQNIPYLEVLGKKFDLSLDKNYILDKLIAMEEQFGNRSKAAVDNVDYKALSHAVRVILEVKELLSTNNIEFPLEYRYYLKKIKAGEKPLEEVIETIESQIKIVDKLLQKSELPSACDIKVIDKLKLVLIETM